MKYTFLGFLFSFFVISCSTDSTENYEVGGEFIDDNIEIRVIDTFTVNTGTFKLEPIVTSDTDRILLGSIKDDNLGTLTSQSYFQLKGVSLALNSKARYDSIGFVLNYDNYYYGDTLQTQTYKIYEINEAVEPDDDDDDDFFNTSKLDFDKNNPLGQASFIPRPDRSTDSIYIQLNDDLGLEIFNGIQNKEITDSVDFLKRLRGLTIVPDTITNPNTHLLGFNAANTGGVVKNSSMRIYYTLEDVNGIDQNFNLEFVVSSPSEIFNKIHANFNEADENSEFSQAIKNKDIQNDSEIVISSKDSGNEFYAQAGSGVSARISIPSIKKLNELSDNGTLLDAGLSFTAKKGTYNDANPLQETLTVYIIDSKNRIVKSLTDILGNNVSAVLEEDEFGFDEDYYSIDLTGFVEEILREEENLGYSLMIQYEDIEKSGDRIVIENSEINSEKIKLTVKYLNY